MAKEKWIEEQQQGYKNHIIAKVIKDLEEALAYAKSGDFDTAYRLAGGASQAIMEFGL